MLVGSVGNVSRLGLWLRSSPRSRRVQEIASTLYRLEACGGFSMLKPHPLRVVAGRILVSVPHVHKNIEPGVILEIHDIARACAAVL